MGLVARSHYDFVGISVGVTSVAADISKVVANLRARSTNKKLVVGIGGPGPSVQPDSFGACGADFISTDAVDAVIKAEAALSGQDQNG